MPPMLDITFLELMRRAEEEMLTHETRVCMYERHHVLQLVPKTESPPRLVVSAAGPETAHYSLVQEPAIGQEIYGLVGCLHLHCAKRVIPVLPHRFKRIDSRCSTPETTHQFAGVIGIRSEIYGLVGCLHLHCAKRVIPVLPHRFKRIDSRCSTPETTHQFAGVIGI